MNIESAYTWPAEWELQAATWIAWPHNLDTWPGRFEPIPECFRRLIVAINDVQPVHVLAGAGDSAAQAQQMVGHLPNVRIHPVMTNDAWIRDYGPTFVRRRDDGSLLGVDWKYNAWGGKYPPYANDAAAAEAICRIVGCPRNVSAIYCEGGSLDTDGQGTLLTTSSCLLNPNRNPGWPVKWVEEELRRQLGIRKVLWIDGGGLEGDDTDGHIDQLARFVNPETVVVATSSDNNDPNRAGLEQNRALLEKSSNAAGERFQVVALPTPPPRYIDNARVPESYCNFLLANGIVILPTFRQEHTDQAAIELMSALFPSRTVIPLDAYDLVWGLGAFHCATQQQPAAEINSTAGERIRQSAGS